MTTTTITAVHTRVVKWPLEPRGAARGVWSQRVSVIVGVRTANGATGLGEAAPLPGVSSDTLDDVVRACDAFAAQVPLAIAQPADAMAIAARCSASLATRFAVETALLTALAQHKRTSVAALLTPNPLAMLRLAAVVDTIDEAHHATAAGYTCLKIKASSVDAVLRIARAVPGVRLRIDANRSWPRAKTIAWLTQLAALPIDYVEEPCMNTHELLRELLPCRIALDESLIALSAAELERALHSPSLAALVLKPTLLGGFASCLDLASLAQRHGVAPIASHALEGPIGTQACFELARAIAVDVPVGLAPHPALAHFEVRARE